MLDKAEKDMRRLSQRGLEHTLMRKNRDSQRVVGNPIMGKHVREALREVLDDTGDLFQITQK